MEKRGDKEGPKLAAVRAPELKRPMPKSWSAPEPLFNGKDLTGWEPIGNVQNNKWVARDGELVNDNPEVAGQRSPGAANIKTTRKFQDFKLHIEVSARKAATAGSICADGTRSRSGPRAARSRRMRWARSTATTLLRPTCRSAWASGARSTLRLWAATSTVVRDGVTLHNNVEIPGPTGGALDSNESEPGPFFLQGDHHGVIRYRNITVQVPK